MFLGPVHFFLLCLFERCCEALGLAWLGFCPASCIPMGPGRSSSLRIGGDSSAEPGSRRTGGESNCSATVVLRDAPGEPSSPLGKGKGKIDEIKYPMGSEYLK